MGKHGNRGLALKLWPAHDQQAWERAFQPGSLLRRGAGLRLSASSRDGLKYAHGMMLGFLAANYPERMDLKLEERLTPEIVEVFISTIACTCRETTIGIVLYRELMALELMDPGADLAWFKKVCSRQRRRGVRLEHRQVTSFELLNAGQNLIDRARKGSFSHAVTNETAAIFRDGLMIKLLAHYPVRRANFAALEIDTTLFRNGDRWSIYLPPENVKTRRSQHYELSAELTIDMDEYLTKYRPNFPDAQNHGWVWPYEDRRMGDKMVRRYIAKNTKSELGFEVTPHRFRSAAATFISIEDPENIRAASDLLGHRDSSVTEKHYIEGAHSRMAGTHMNRLIAQMREREGDYDISA